MSVLQTMRDRAGALLAIIIGVTIIVFVLSDSLGSGGGQNRQAKKYYEIAKIGRESISYQDFDLRIQNLAEIYKMSGTTEITESLSESMREQVWTQLVEEKLLGSEMASLGIGVSSDEVEYMVFGEEPHPMVQQLFANPETGMLDRSFLVNFLKATEYDPQTKAYWLYFEDEIVTSKSREKLSTLISKGLFVTGKQVEYEAMLNASSVDFSFIMKPYAMVADTAVTVTDSEIEKRYNRDRDSFHQDAARSMEYVEFEVLPSAQDIAETEKSVTNLIEEFKNSDDPVQMINLTADTRHFEHFQSINEVSDLLKEFVATENRTEVFGPYVEDNTYKIARLIGVENRPDSVNARHILVTPNRFGTREAARVQADSLKRLIESGADFGALALMNSEDQGSAQLGGDLGWFGEGQMVTPFNNACFEGKRGDIVIAETTFGFHIIEILNQKGSSKKYHVGIIDRSIEPSSTTYQNIYSEASRFAGMNNTYEKFNAAVAEGNLNKKIASNLGPEEKIIAGLESPRYLVMSLFETGEKNIVLDRSEQAVFELGNKFVVAYCTEIREEGVAPLADVRSDIRYELLKEKKGDKIAAEMKGAMEGAATIEAVASKLNLNVQEATTVSFNTYSLPGAGIEPAVISKAAGSSEGTIAGPVKGENGVFVIAVNTVTANPYAQQPDMLKTRLTSNFQLRAAYEALEALKDREVVKDMRYKFY